MDTDMGWLLMRLPFVLLGSGLTLLGVVAWLESKRERRDGQLDRFRQWEGR